MKKSRFFLVITFLCLVFAGCTTIANKEDLDLLGTEIDQKLAASEAKISKRFQEIDSRIESMQQTIQQQQAVLLSVSEDTKGQIKELKIAVDDTLQNQRKEFELFKKGQEEKNGLFNQEIEAVKKSQNELIRTSISLTDSMVNFQKDLLAVKTSMQQIATEFDAVNTKNFVQENEIVNLKKYYDGQIETLLKEIVRQESEIFLLKQALLKKQTAHENTEVQPAKTADSPTKYYAVKKGDTLSSIAKKYGTTTKKLREINNMKKDDIIIGQKLLIP